MNFLKLDPMVKETNNSLLWSLTFFLGWLLVMIAEAYCVTDVCVVSVDFCVACKFVHENLRAC
jgi:hypothetical protein